MKNIQKKLFIPLFAALAVSCSSPVALETSEYDDVYYTSKDKTIIQERTVTAATTETAETSQTSESREVAADNAVPNPEYSEKNSGTGNSYRDQDYASTEDYYSDDYLYSSQLRRSYAPYRSGLSYYDMAYTDYLWYNRNPYLYGRSAFYDPFLSYYDPFYSPYYDYGFRYPRIYTGLTVVIGRPFYGGFYGGNPYYGGGGYGGYGGFNRGGWYGGGANRYYANSGWYRNDTNDAATVQYGRRRDRSEVPDANAGSNRGGRSRNDVGTVNSGGGVGGVVAPGGSRGDRVVDANGRSSRSRATVNETAPGVDGTTGTAAPGTERPTRSPERSTRVGRQDRNVIINGDDQGNTAPAQPNMERPTRRNRVETNDYNFPDQPARTMEERPAVRPRNERSSERYTPAPDQPQQRRMEEIAPREQRREQYQPQRMERQERVRETPSYQAPRQERSYEAPRTYDQPSRSMPSSGGGSSDGGGSSGRGGRPRN